MPDATTSLARLECDEPTARRLASLLSEALDPVETVCSAFEDQDTLRWRVEVHFQHPPDEAALRTLVRDALDERAAEALTFESVADKDWVAASLAGLKPVHAGRFVVHGAHDRANIPSHRIGIEIEAALAFGTGHHGTTRGCLLALDRLAKRRRGHPPRTLDLGTGSGVLAIAAARRLHARVLATDIDRIATTAARGNARLNHAKGIEFITIAGARGGRIRARAPYDLIFANILLPPLMRMAAPVARLAAPGARIVLSGLLPSQANAALAAYRMQGLRLERRIPLDGWMTLVLRRG